MTPGILQRNFTTRTKPPQTGTTSRRSEDISSHRWLPTAESTLAPRRPSPSLACCLSDSTRGVREIQETRHPRQCKAAAVSAVASYTTFILPLGLEPFQQGMNHCFNLIVREGGVMRWLLPARAVGQLLRRAL